MSKITVSEGWRKIVDEAIAETATLPSDWLFEIVSTATVDGALKLSATYVSGDVPLDDHLPPQHKLRHPYRSFVEIRENAKTKSLVTCECCGHAGKLINVASEARVRCMRHVNVLNVSNGILQSIQSDETNI